MFQSVSLVYGQLQLSYTNMITTSVIQCYTTKNECEGQAFGCFWHLSVSFLLQKILTPGSSHSKSSTGQKPGHDMERSMVFRHSALVIFHPSIGCTWQRTQSQSKAETTQLRPGLTGGLGPLATWRWNRMPQGFTHIIFLYFRECWSNSPPHLWPGKGTAPNHFWYQTTLATEVLEMIHELHPIPPKTMPRYISPKPWQCLSAVFFTT